MNMRFSFIVASLVLGGTLFGDPVIILFMHPYPFYQKQYLTVDEAKKLHKKITKPGKLAKINLKRACPNIVAGVMSTYGGFLGISDASGQTTLPMSMVVPIPSLRIVVTPRLTPIVMFGHTIHHWEIDPGDPYDIYHIERKTDEQTGITFWQVEPGARLTDNRISLDTIVIFAKPEHVVIPIGISLTDDTPNYVLPDIYIKQQIDITKHALSSLFLLHYFGPVNPLITTRPKGYATRIVY